MRRRKNFAESGYVLLEALISVVIFAIGVLGLIAMLGTAIKNNSEVESRFAACLIASELIGRMWADNRIPSVLQSDYQGGEGSDGVDYTDWLTSIISNKRLPGVSSTANVPVVRIETVDGPSPPDSAKSRVTITLRWQMPGGDPHNYVVTTMIK